MVVTRPFRFAFNELIIHRRKQLPFWMLVGFLPTFLGARLIVRTNPDLFANINGVHVHHFTWGFFILAIIGFVAITTSRYRRIQAVVYGVGLAMAFDEFGMWLHLTTNYDVEASEIAIALIASFLVFVVYGIGILRRAWPHLKRLYGWGRRRTP
jgi:hypothetical protein